MSNGFRCIFLIVPVAALAGCLAENGSGPNSAQPQYGATASEARQITLDKERRFDELLQAKLREPVFWQFRDMPLSDFVRQLNTELGVNVRIDTGALEEIGLNADETVTAEFTGVVGGTALELTLKDLQLDWMVVGNVMLISTPQKIEDAIVARVYPVQDLLSSMGPGLRGADFDDLIDVIVSTVYTDTWAENGGGEADIRPLRVRGQAVLVVSQTWRAHQAIGDLLHDLRATPARVAGAKQAPAVGAAVPKGLEGVAGNEGENTKSSYGRASNSVDLALLLPGSEGLQSAARGNNEFSIELFRAIAADSGANELVSGYSARESLTLACLGAAGETREVLAKLLRIPGDSAQVGAEAMSLRAYVSDDGHGASAFQSANSIWLQSELKARETYLLQTKEVMGAVFRPIDFRQKATAMAEINQWTSQHTRGRIPKIIQEQDITPATAFMLVNAACFDGKWQTPFDETLTKPGEFTLASGEVVQTDMMHGTLEAHYLSDDESNLRMAELPYRDRSKSLVVVLPDEEPGALAQLKSKLDANMLENWIAESDLRDVVVQLPKFSFRARHNLKEQLVALGGAKLFDSNAADFSGIADGQLFLERVIHETYIDVDESGTQAGAATGGGGGFGGPPPRPPKLIVDRPFLIFIRDTTTGCILFAGQVMDPRAK